MHTWRRSTLVRATAGRRALVLGCRDMHPLLIQYSVVTTCAINPIHRATYNLLRSDVCN